MPAPSLSAPYTLELVTYNLNDDADAETFWHSIVKLVRLLPAFNPGFSIVKLAKTTTVLG